MKTINTFLIFLVLFNSIAFSQKNYSYVESLEFNELKKPLHRYLRDSIVNDSIKLKLETSFYCHKDIYLNKNKEIRFKNNPDANFITLYSHAFGNLKQKIVISNNGKLLKKITSNELFFKKPISMFLGLTKKDSIDSFFNSIYLLKGTKEDLFLIEDCWMFNTVLYALFNMKGEMIWWELSSNYINKKSGKLEPLLIKYGINKHALEDKYLKKCIRIHHLIW